MKKRIFALAAVAAMAVSATACSLNLGHDVTDEEAAIHAQYTKGYMLEVEAEEEGDLPVTHFYACDDENTVASYGFYTGSEEEEGSVDMSIFVTGEVEQQEDGTFLINQEDAFFEAVYQAEFLEDGSLSLIVDGEEPMIMPFTGAEPVVTLMKETSGLHMNMNLDE